MASCVQAQNCLRTEKNSKTQGSLCVRSRTWPHYLVGAPKTYGYDRGGYSADNMKELRKLGVRDVGLAPRGKTAWSVTAKVKRKLNRERALVDDSIGTIKTVKYGFNRPAARSAAMMGMCGQRATLGYNLTKLVRAVAEKRRIPLAT